MNGKIIIMKRYYLYLLSIIVLISCSKEQDTITNNGVNYSPKFYAEIDNTLTRTYVNDALKVCWNKNDKLSVFTSTENQLYQFDGNTGDSEGTFSRVESYNSSNGHHSLSVDANYAVFPYCQETTISTDGMVTYNLPQTQLYTRNGFSINSNPMIAITEDKADTYLSFMNVCGYLRLYLYGDSITVKSIRLEGNQNEKLSGTANIAMSYNSAPILNISEDAFTSIILDCDNGIELGSTSENATEFWFVIPPICFEKGFSIIVEDTEGNRYSKSTDKKIEIKRNSISNMAISELNQLLEYHLFKKEIDGIDGIITQDDTYALLMHVDSLSNEVLIFGENKETYKPNYALFDQIGFLQNLFVDEESYIVSYSSDGLRVVGVTNDFDNILPYSSLEQYSGNSEQLTRTTIRDASWIKATNIVESVCDFIKNPKGSILKWVTQNYLKGKYQRNGYIASDLIDLILSRGASLSSWLTFLEEWGNAAFWGNVWVETLPAEINKCVEVTLSCEVSNMETFSPFKFHQLIFDFELSAMELSMNTYTEDDNIIQSQKRNISSNGVEKFLFTVPKLNAKYLFMPILQCSYTCNPKYEDISYNIIASNYSIFNIEDFQSKSFSVTRKLSGKKLNFRTPSVSSSVENVENEKSTSADVVCSFSDVPSGAECQILITKEGTDISQIFSGQPDCKNQKVSVSGLTPSTTYIASSRIIYKGIPYNGSKSVSFSTPGPSGYLISIPEEQITTTSAIVKCQFSNVGSGVECGIIVKGEDGSSKTISASNVESEQDVTISGLQPATQYTCTSYVKLTHSQGSYYKEGNSLSFTTDLPDVTGTWTCKEKHGENYETYTVTLHKDGTVTTSKSELEDNYKYKSWSQSAKGLSVRFTRFDGNMGHDLYITFDDPTNPTSGKGETHRWIVSEFGISHDTWYNLEMTR